MSPRTFQLMPCASTNMTEPTLFEGSWNFLSDIIPVLHCNCQGLLEGCARYAYQPVDAHSKLNYVRYLLSLSNSPQIVCFTETKFSKRIPDQEVQVQDYTLYRRDRPKQGGGIAIYCRSILNAKLIYDFDDFPIELVAVKIPRQRCKPIVVVCIYSPPPTKPVWIAALQAALSKITSLYSSIIIVDDFNVDLLKVPQFSEELCDSFALEQRARSPMRVTSHSATLIDHVYTYGIGISSTQACELFIADHYSMICN